METIPGTSIPRKVVAALMNLGLEDAQILSQYPELTPEDLAETRRWAEENPLVQYDPEADALGVRLRVGKPNRYEYPDEAVTLFYRNSELVGLTIEEYSRNLASLDRVPAWARERIENKLPGVELDPARKVVEVILQPGAVPDQEVNLGSGRKAFLKGTEVVRLEFEDKRPLRYGGLPHEAVVARLLKAAGVEARP
jgi:uncharacterized protein (DUF433 family)